MAQELQAILCTCLKSSWYLLTFHMLSHVSLWALAFPFSLRMGCLTISDSLQRPPLAQFRAAALYTTIFHTTSLQPLQASHAVCTESHGKPCDLEIIKSTIFIKFFYYKAVVSNQICVPETLFNIFYSAEIQQFSISFSLKFSSVQYTLLQYTLPSIKALPRSCRNASYSATFAVVKSH